MDSIIRPIKELVMLVFWSIVFGGIFLSLIGMLMVVSY